MRRFPLALILATACALNHSAQPLSADKDLLHPDPRCRVISQRLADTLRLPDLEVRACDSFVYVVVPIIPDTAIYVKGRSMEELNRIAALSWRIAGSKADSVEIGEASGDFEGSHVFSRQKLSPTN